MWGFDGNQDYGENFNNVQTKLSVVDKISSIYVAFAAVLIGGSMVPWGCRVFTTYVAFVAVLKDGTMVTWGERDMVEKLRQYRRR